MSALAVFLELGMALGFFAAILGANVFILFYGLFVRWQDKPFGKHLFAFMLVLTIVLDHNLIQEFWPNYPGEEVVWFILSWAMAWVIWWRFKILVTVQRRRHHEGESKRAPEVPQGRHVNVGGADAADVAVVEGVDPLGRRDERMG